MSRYSEEVKPVVEQVKQLMAQGDKAAAQEVVRQFGSKWDFPRLDEIMKEYEDADRGGKWLWGQWGPGEDIVAQATCSLKESFLQHAADLMVSKGTSQGRDLAASELGIKGAQYVAAGDNPCAWCSSLDGMECDYPSEEYEKYSPPQHCQCDDCFWVYVAEEESNWHPDEEWDSTILDRINEQGYEYSSIEEAMAEHAHANPYWETQRANDESDQLVSLHAVERLANEMGKDIESEESTEGTLNTQEKNDIMEKKRIDSQSPVSIPPNEKIETYQERYKKWEKINFEPGKEDPRIIYYSEENVKKAKDCYESNLKNGIKAPDGSIVKVTEMDFYHIIADPVFIRHPERIEGFIKNTEKILQEPKGAKIYYSYDPAGYVVSDDICKSAHYFGKKNTEKEVNKKIARKLSQGGKLIWEKD